MYDQELIPSTDIERIIAKRADYIKRITSAVNELNAIESEMRDEFYKYFRYYNNSSSSLHIGYDPIPIATKNIDKALWEYLLQKTNIWNVMDAKTKAKFNKDLENPPEITIDNVANTFAEILSSRGDYFEQGIINLFKSLSWVYKTNQPQKIGKKIIMTNLIDSYGHTINYHKRDVLIDLERIMLTLDNKPQPDGNHTLPERFRDYCKANKGTSVYDDDYLSIKFYQNLNGHITFKRLDIIEKMNKVIAKHYPNALPAPK